MRNVHYYSNRKWCNDGWILDSEKSVECFDRALVVFTEKGAIIRWKMGNSVPSDVLTEWVDLGLIPQSTYDNTIIYNNKKVEKQLADYRKKKHVYSAEEMSEMRNVFGEGARVVNAITGASITV